MKFTTESWRAVSGLLDEALDLEPQARDAWFEGIARTRPDIAPALRRLLAAHASSETADVLARPPALAVTGAPRADDAGLAAGDRVGPYRLMREIGSGGMADVWLAERADGAFTRTVALKLPRVTRLRRDLAARFARERDILARLEHPHIARLYDAGVTSDGLPYLAMEYVEGQPITRYCDERRLDIRTRLKLFIQVLEAVQYAHANLVIHRDLKPSNILVTADGQVRLLDFGIAKLLADDDTARETQLTQLAGRALTPDYASPEQIKGEPLTIASDVYSLGVVLYELLCGSRPYKLKVQSAAQLELAILEAEPAVPSSSLAEAAAAARSTTTVRLARALHGDLDTIARKALAKMPADRYPTIGEFAGDLRRHGAGEPVLARPASFAYRARKFVARNRVPVAAAASVAVALLAGIAVSLWQAGVAREQARVAEREARRAQAVQNFVLDIFRANSDRQKDPARARNTTARDLLDLGTERLESALLDAPESRAEVMKTLSEMYYQLQLEERSAAIEERRIALLKQIHGPDDPRVAEALVNFAAALHATPRRSEILPALDEARRILDRNGDYTSRLRGELLTRLAQRHQNMSFEKMQVYADDAVRVLRPHQVPNEDRLSTALHLAARARVQNGDYAGGERLYRESIAELRKSAPIPQVAVLQALVSLAESLAAQQKFDEAVATYRAAADGVRKYLGPGDPGVIVAESRLAALLHAIGERTEARRLHEQALRTALAQKGDADTLFTPIARMDYGRSLFAEGRIAAAADLIARVNASNRVHYAGSAVLGQGLRSEALVLLAQGRYAESRQLFAEALAIWRKGTGANLHPSRFNRFHLDQARLDLAVGDARQAIGRLREIVPPQNAESLPLRSDEVERDALLAQAHLQLGDVHLARTAARAAVDALLRSPARRHFPALEADASLRLGQALQAVGELGAARASIARAVELRTALDHATSPWLAEAQIALAECLIALGQANAARDLIAKAGVIHAAHGTLGVHFTEPLKAAARRLARRGAA
jgi:serine/threonine-protein kinase